MAADFMESPIHKLLSKEQAWLTRRRLVMLLINAALCFGVPAAICGVVDLFRPFAEAASFAVITSFAIFGVLVFLARLMTIRRRLPKIHDVAVRVENGCPEMMDSLITATELLEKPDDQLNPLNHALLRKVEAELEEQDIHRLVAAGETAAGSVLLLFIFCAAVLGSGHMMPIGKKARAHAIDLFRGQPSGILVAPGNVEVAADDTVKVTAKVRRGPTDDIRILVVDERGSHEYRMTDEAEREFVFELYGVTDDFEYHVFSSTVSSVTYHVTVYQRPAMEEIQLTVQPPAYTRLPKQEFAVLQDLVVPEGSQISIQFVGNMPMDAELLLDNNAPIAFTGGEGNSYVGTVVITENTTYGMSLEDAQGHRVQLDDRYNIEVIEDFAPIIQITSPDEETSRHDKDHDVPILAEITDDYGVGTVRLFLNINGNGWRSRDVYTPAGENDVSKMVADVLKLDGIVEYGDVISYYLEASDQAEPKPNAGRCDIRFLEIHPPETPPKKEKGEGAGEQEKLSVTDLIIRLKHTIKETFAAELIRDPDKRKERLHELSRRTADIHTEAKQRFKKIKDSVKKKREEKANEKPEAAEDENAQEQPRPMNWRSPRTPRYRLIQDLGEETKEEVPPAQEIVPEPGPPRMPKPGELLDDGLGQFGEWFDDITRDLNRAQGLLDKELPREALDYHQGALSRFTKIQIELEKNKRESEGKGKGKGEGSKKNEKMAEENQEKERREQLEEVQQAMRKLDQLIDRQDALNRRMGRADTNKDANELSYMENKQKDISAEAEELKRRMVDKTPDVQQGISNLSKALTQMDKSKRRLSTKQPATAHKHGDQARQFLERTREQLQEYRNRLTGQKLDEAMAKLDQLKQAQEQLGKDTQAQAQGGTKPGREQAGKMADQQKGIQQQFENLMNDLDRVGEELEETMPGAVEKLSEALQDAAQQRVGQNMKRSSNALRYRQMERADEFQEKVRQALEKLSENLQSVRDNSQSLSPQELSDMLQRTLQNRQAAKDNAKMSDEERKELLKAMKSELEKMSAKLRSKRMQELSNMMNGIGEPGAGTPIDRKAEKILSEAARLLERKLFESMMRRQLKLGRIHGSQAPDTYRKLVDQYFKSLSESEEQ